MSTGVLEETMTRSRLNERDPVLDGLRVLVVGAGRSGMAAARFAGERGAAVRLCDGKPEDALAREAAEAAKLGIPLLAGGHPPELAQQCDLIVLSPGVPTDVPLVRAAADRNVPVWSEIELAARFCRGRVIGVTGSNGKSTVTSMVGTILRGAGIPGGTGGNLADPFLTLLDRDGPEAWHALELSSFQLETTHTLRADVAVVLNLTADHLDRHRTLSAYAAAKSRLLELQRSEAHALLNRDDPEHDRFRDSVRGQLAWFSTRGAVERGGFLRGDRLVLRTGGTDELLMPADELPVPGAHNVANALAAATACRLAGCTPEAIASGLRAYRALPHRLEPVGEIGGVRFFNDSKATNPASTACALGAFEPGRVHLILGGRDKDADWKPLTPLIRSHARRVLLVGEAAPVLRRALGDAATLVDCGTVECAVRRGIQDASPGDVVLLSPGCASFDQYAGFEERGEDFRRAVGELRHG